MSTTSKEPPVGTALYGILYGVLQQLMTHGATFVMSVSYLCYDDLIKLMVFI